ncbi:type VI secretion system tube protein TssD [Flavobacterium hercynium]|uniref:Phage tail protein n=1 Tax=Flavobacterium hercynium TaxID=387094 RepID=A0A226HM16_9FLAO|nr:type VI secretion system tube protein TssD [Flavobacterium hercynium]OXA94898.1 hypothetical protein B0A66_04030 [Flavobacterium hercynium]SMP09211.1 hypothetical protein SAMN06265346_102234 [Flavobacterium hercynium]
MSFLAKLMIDGGEFNVLDFKIQFQSKKDTSGKPFGGVKGGTIKIVIEADQHTDFLAWILNHNLGKDGKIVFYRRDALGKMKDLKFERAHCIDYEEEFSSTSDSPMTIKMEIIAKEILFSDAKFSNDWTD